MKIKLLGLLMCSFPCFALTSGGYQVSVSVKDSEKELIFPSLKVPFFDQKVTSQADDCTYSVKITQEDAAAIRLEAQMHCHYKDGDSYMNMPFFVLNSSGQVASVEIGDEDADMWKYSVDVEPLN
ncbi:hypothetical protein UB34_20465 [Photobacterium leiognathi]|uniref:Uncharacterized protein n=2 Tax=Photobacterium leiognathi TaxID=553611 RepID=A0A2T3M6Q6_PHOLE|nr:hypothetical protein UB34_20465 [Photobacterium leiognathi]PSV87660.1 hypothetical protein CTM89_16575 [Photobacterium leiognathi]